MKPYIHQSFWSDPDVEGQPAEIKLVALWLITNSQTSILGLCKASERRFSFETGLSSDYLQRACEALPRALNKIGGSIFIRNFIRHQFGAGESLQKNNYFRALSAAFLGESDEIQKEILSEYTEFKEAHKGFQRASKPKDRIGKDRIGKDRIGKDRIGKDRIGKDRIEPEIVSPEFDEFWEAYPRKVQKIDAEKAWKRLKPDLKKCLTALSRQKSSPQWRKDGGQFIPYPATWINAGQWDDAEKVDVARQTIPLRSGEQPPVFDPLKD